MCEVKFTKGEWSVTSQFGVSIGEFVGSSVFTQNTGCVTSSVSERESNAHLIAAAPEMYSILNDAMIKLSFGDYESKLISDDIKSLLAKARGEHV